MEGHTVSSALEFTFIKALPICSRATFTFMKANTRLTRSPSAFMKAIPNPTPATSAFMKAVAESRRCAPQEKLNAPHRCVSDIAGAVSSVITGLATAKTTPPAKPQLSRSLVSPIRTVVPAPPKAGTQPARLLHPNQLDSRPRKARE